MIVCVECGRPYPGLACGPCLLVKGQDFLLQRALEAFAVGKAQIVVDGHLSIDRDGWRTVLKKYNIAPGTFRYISFCGESYRDYKGRYPGQVTTVEKVLNNKKFVCKKCLEVLRLLCASNSSWWLIAERERN